MSTAGKEDKQHKNKIV